MLFMNDYDIRCAVDRFSDHPVLSKATNFLAALAEEANAHSDGWHSWPAPCKAAKKLMELIQRGHATQEEYITALAPIRAFYTRRGNAAGMELPSKL